MRIVTPKELSTFKILPFDLYNESNEKILSAGEVLTPGKLIMLKSYPNVYTEEFSNDVSGLNGKKIDFGEIKNLTEFTYESLDPSDFETVVNKDGILEIEDQVKIKYFYRKVMDLFAQEYYEDGLVKLYILVDMFYKNIFKKYGKMGKGSQMRFLGEYEICHPLNVAIVAGLIAKKLEYQQQDIEQIIMAAFIHDIGKFKIHLTEGDPLTITNEESVVAHTKIGYDIIKNVMNLSDNIARVALEHHENNDGSGYPQGLSNDYISEWGQIINVANYYDNLASNRTTTHVTSNRDALRTMLEIGTKRFSAKILYTFIHMFAYDDPKDFSDMTL
ncbi:MAG: HD domain-containing protein [bacterium]|nr:HD domain-containing protein [bacterium]